MQNNFSQLQHQLHNTWGELQRALARGDVAEAKTWLASLRALNPGQQHLDLFTQQLAVISFDWPLPRAAYAPTPRPAPAPDDIDLVAFHVNMETALSGIHQKIDYFAVLALSFESAMIRAPRARRLLITDEDTTVPASLPVDEVIRRPLDKSKLMYERMRAQSLYLAERQEDRVSVLMDSDLVVNREPSSVFAEDFDLGLTWRPEFPDAPFNGGAIFVGTGSRGFDFFHRALVCYDALVADPSVAARFPRDLRGWWGDQFALAATVGHRAFGQRQGDGIEVAGIRVRMFPCSEYNCTIEPNVRYAEDVLARKYFVHFKGNRKPMQAQYLAMMRAALRR